MKKILSVFIAAFLVPPLAASASFPAVQPRLVDSSLGLSNNFVISLAADAQGYVWAGTESGLNRISPGVCTVFRCSPLARSGRGNGNRIGTLYHDAATGLLFVGTEGGLCILNTLTGQFVTTVIGDSLVGYSVEDIFPSADGTLWIAYANGRLQRIDARSLRVSSLPDSGLQSVRSGLDDRQGHLLIGHNKQGMSLVDSRTGSVLRRFVHEAGHPGSIPGDNVRCIRQDSRGRIWVGTDHGLALYEPQTGRFRRVTHCGSAFDDNVFDIRQMADGSLWVACDVGGVSILDADAIPADGPLCFSERQPAGLTSLNSRALLQDAFGNVWVGHHSTGIDFLAVKEPPLHLLPYYSEPGRMKDVHAIADDGQGRLWVNGGDYLSLWQATQMLGEWRIGGMRSRAHSIARSMMADSRGGIWLGMEDEGVIRYDSHTRRFSPIDIGYDAPDVHCFFEDRDGRVWIGSEMGVCSYQQGVVTHEERIDRLTRRAPATGFLMLGDGRLAVATQGNGLLLYDPRRREGLVLHRSDGLPSENINMMISDRHQGLWLATNAGLVHMADTDRPRRMQLLSTAQGLPDASVQAIITDPYGRLWGSTFSGIFCYDPASATFHSYTGHAGLSAVGFSAGAVARMSNGCIAFGSANGVVFIHPDDNGLAGGAVTPKIAVIEALLPTGDDRRLQPLAPDADGSIDLDYDQNTLRIQVTHDNYANKGYVDFAYKMRGLGDQWYDVDAEQTVMFNSLPPGRYTFVVRAKLRSQNWSEAAEQSLAIVVHPPLWRSWWAWAVYVAVGLLWLLYALRSYQRRLALKASVAMEKRESLHRQQLNEERLRFFTNITHELRTPLTLILGPLENLADDHSLPPKAHRLVGTIQKHALRLRDLINGILEFRKTETQNRRLTVARGALGAFVEEVVANFRSLGRNAQVDLPCIVAPDLPQVYFDSEVIQIVLSNFLSNALKYTPQGSITTRVAADGDRITLSVSDTGYGIPRDALPHIFERYYRADGSHQASGTGIGLALVRSLADLHEARVSVSSEEGRGSTFSFSLSIANTYPDALHKEDAGSGEFAPVGQADYALADEAPAAEEGRLQLLIVEDNADIRQYVADSLADDFSVLQADDGEQGLAMARQHIPDVIVSDVIMPSMDGIRLTRSLKGDVRTSHIPVVLLTAKATDDDRLEGYECGADSFITKPFTARMLVSRIQNLLTARRRMAEYLVSHPVLPAEPANGGERRLSRLDREFLDRLNGIIADNIMSQDLDLPFVTRQMAMSHSTFYRKVKALTGKTATEYIRTFRLRQSYRLLESGDYNVGEAAAMTGFNQMAHFREVFKREFGILPSEVMKKKQA